jgi:hypothetical protein
VFLAALLSKDLTQNLVDIDPTVREPYEAAFARVFPAAKEAILLLRVEPVANNDAAAFLLGSRLETKLVGTALASNAFAPFLTTPFSIRLLTRALPDLINEHSIAIDELYRAYVTVTFLREDPMLTAADLQTAMRALGEVARGKHFATEGKLQALALHSGLLRTEERHFEFSHYSLWEYFIARGLLDDMCEFDSRFLSSLDLVGAYNINRILLPMTIRAIEQRATARRVQRSIASPIPRPSDPPDKRRLVRVVQPNEYLAFLKETGWRAISGYGIHPSMISSYDGTPSASFPVSRDDGWSIHCNRVHGTEIASAVSWYDAAVFALHSGLRLPSSMEIRTLPFRGDYLFWCSDWHNEQIAHVSAFASRTTSIQGLNPDVRLSRTAIAVLE